MNGSELIVQPSTPTIGAEVSGLDLSAPLSEPLRTELRAALCRYSVLFFRDQDLQPTQQLELARAFGTVEETSHPKFEPAPGCPAVSVVVNDAERPPDVNVWHTDLTFRERPVAACVLYCVECPPSGGDTLWTSMRAAYQSLSPALQAYLKTLRARHRLPVDGIDPALLAKAPTQDTEAVQPVVCRIPETDQEYLFVNRVYTQRILDVPAHESAALLHMLGGLAEIPEFQVRFSWREGSLAIWDNRCTQHYAVADYYPQRRVMHRVTVAGAAPVAAGELPS